MYKIIDFKQLGGFPFNQNSLAFMQDGYSGLSEAIVALVGNNVILSGVEVAGETLTEGWMTYNNELIPFKSGANMDYFQIRTDKTELKFKNGENKTVLFSKYAQPSGSGILLSSLRRYRAKEIDWVTCEPTADIEVIEPIQARINERGKVEVKGSYKRKEDSSYFYDFKVPDLMLPFSNRISALRQRDSARIMIPLYIPSDGTARASFPDWLVSGGYVCDIKCEYEL